MRTQTGEPEFNAPEMLSGFRNNYDQTVDIWGLGVCFYILLAKGKSPFYH